VVILMTLHPTLVKQVLTFFSCSSPILGKRYLLADIDIVCGSSEHIAMVSFIGIPIFVIYILGIPMAVGMYLVWYRTRLHEKWFRETVGFLYANYKPHCFLWELVIILRLVVLTVINIYFEKTPFLQTILASQVLFLGVVLHTVYRPYQNDLLDSVEIFSLASSILTLTSGTVLFSNTVPEEWKTYASIVVFFCVLAFTLYCITLTVYALNKRRVRKRDTSTKSSKDPMTPERNSTLRISDTTMNDDKHLELAYIVRNPMLSESKKI